MFFLAAFFDNVWNHLHGSVNFWTVFGLIGNAMFTSRFVVQWYVSERLKQSVIPRNFWHLSLAGGVIQLVYALHIGAVPIILGYLLPPVIAARNLVLIGRHSRVSPPSSPDGAEPNGRTVGSHSVAVELAPDSFSGTMDGSVMHRSLPDLLYFDNNATTALDPEVVEAMMPYLTRLYGNPSSAYHFGTQVRTAIEHAREQVANLLGCEAREIVFTSCGSEGNSSAIMSALAADRDRRHIVTSTVEHSATKNLCEALARKGYEITWLPVDSEGRLDPNEAASAIREDTAVVSLMWANNETGVLFPVEEIAAAARSKGTYFHTDAIQAVGKVPVELGHSPIHFLSLAGHKLHAPKGIGALYVNRRTRFTPFLIGGSQEGGRRGGTENVASIVAFGKAAELAARNLELEATMVRGLRDQFENEILAKLPGVQINGDSTNRLPNTTNLFFPGLDGEALLVLLDKAGLCASAGSACTAGSLHPSHVLSAMGFPSERARGSLRFSFSRFNTPEEIERGVKILVQGIERLRGLLPAIVS